MRLKSHNRVFRKNFRRIRINSKSIGKTLAAESYPSTIDSYWFVIRQGTILNTFDFFTVDNFKSKTIGLVQDIRALPSNALNNSLSDELVYYGEENKSLKKLHPLPLASTVKHGVIAASVAVLGNTGIKMKSGKVKKSEAKRS